MQLDAFLRSYRAHVMPPGAVRVLYRTTGERHAQSYREVFARHPWADPRRQLPFKFAFIDALPRDGCVVFFVDDQVFIRPWAVIERPDLSLRLGLHLTRNYNANDAPQPLPPYRKTPTSSPANSPGAPELGWKQTLEKPVIWHSQASRSLMSLR